MDRLIADLDREFPGIRGVVVQREMSTAETMKARLNTSVYGFAPTGSPSEAFRFSTRTNIEGLWLASAFTFGGGFGRHLGWRRVRTRRDRVAAIKVRRPPLSADRPQWRHRLEGGPGICARYSMRCLCCRLQRTYTLRIVAVPSWTVGSSRAPARRLSFRCTRTIL
jgi:hypothetical protein